MDLIMSSTATGRATVGPKGRVTIPKAIRQILDVGSGDEVVFQVTDGRVEVIPMALVPRDQVWFYSREMQARVMEAELDIAAGRTTRVSSAKGLGAHLDGLEKQDK